MQQVLFTIEGKLYKGSRGKIHKGDRIFDTKDNTHGKCNLIHDDKKHIVIKDEWCAEVGVPLTRVFKLRLYNKHHHRKCHTTYIIRDVVDNHGEMNVQILAVSK